MDKQTKLLLGLGLVAAGGYLVWKQQQAKPKSFANLMTLGGDIDCGTKNGFDKCCKSKPKNSNGYYECCNGTIARESKDDSGCKQQSSISIL